MKQSVVPLLPFVVLAATATKIEVTPFIGEMKKPWITLRTEVLYRFGFDGKPITESTVTIRHAAKIVKNQIPDSSSLMLVPMESRRQFP
jgi:hypothetical protein